MAFLAGAAAMGLAVDPEYNKLYYTAANAIHVVNVDGSNETALINETGARNLIIELAER